jgi:hypothetical protein
MLVRQSLYDPSFFNSLQAKAVAPEIQLARCKRFLLNGNARLRPAHAA